MKTIVLPGDSVNAACETCQKFVHATWNYGPFAMDNGLIIEQVMRASCSQCGSIVALAHQSAYLLRRALENQKRFRTTLRMPQELKDYVALQLDRAGIAGAPNSYVQLFLRAILAFCRGREVEMAPALQEIEDPVLHRPCTEMVTLTLSKPLLDVVENLKDRTGIQNVSELMRRLLVLWDAEPESFKMVVEDPSQLLLAVAV